MTGEPFLLCVVQLLPELWERVYLEPRLKETKECVDVSVILSLNKQTQNLRELGGLQFATKTGFRGCFCAIPRAFDLGLDLHPITSGSVSCVLGRLSNNFPKHSHPVQIPCIEARAMYPGQTVVTLTSDCCSVNAHMISECGNVTSGRGSAMPLSATSARNES